MLKRSFTRPCHFPSPSPLYLSRLRPQGEHRRHVASCSIVAATITFILVLSGTAGPAAAATPIWWTPKHMTASLIALQYPRQGVFSGVCHGASKARKGAYTAFKCAMGWQITGTAGNPTQSGRITVWAKPLTGGRVCGSTRSLAACQPLKAGPLAGDPTKCAVNDPAACAQAASKAAVVAKHGTQVNLACTQTGTSLYAWLCTSSAGSYTVRWSKGVSQWQATVTP